MSRCRANRDRDRVRQRTRERATEHIGDDLNSTPLATLTRDDRARLKAPRLVSAPAHRVPFRLRPAMGNESGEVLPELWCRSDQGLCGQKFQEIASAEVRQTHDYYARRRRELASEPPKHCAEFLKRFAPQVAG
jgi:hypothetical protein